VDLKALRVILLSALASMMGACAVLSPGPVGNRAVPDPAKPVAIQRYTGRWYEFARFENGFERRCEGVTAEYRVLPNAEIEVINTCRQDAVTGPLKIAHGRAKNVDGARGAKLKVSFFGPFFFGDYWVLDHGDDYSWSIVGEPSGRYLWILTRSSRPDEAMRADLLRRAVQLGYDKGLIRQTAQ